MNKLKEQYNYNLKRYYNGCKYCEENIDQTDKWIPELIKILNNMDNLLKKITKNEIISDEEIMKGFNV